MKIYFSGDKIPHTSIMDQVTVQCIHSGTLNTPLLYFMSE